MPDEVYAIFAAGTQNNVPVIVGSTADEGTTLFAPLLPKDKEAYIAAARTKFGELADEYLALYPAATDEEARAVVSGRHARRMVHVGNAHLGPHDRGAGSKAYLYFFSHVPPSPRSAEVGAYHAAEILYVFNNLPTVAWPFTGVDRKLADDVSSAWVRFAATGNPGGGDVGPWAPYDAASQSYLDLGDAIKPGHALLDAQCNFFDKYYAAKRAKP